MSTVICFCLLIAIKSQNNRRIRKKVGAPQNRPRVIFFAVRKDVQKVNLFYKLERSKDTIHSVREAIGDLPYLHSGEKWGIDTLHPYGYDAVEGHVICRHCLKYNIETRTVCHSCGHDLTNPIRGGVLNFPGVGLMLDCRNHIDNEKLREINLL